ncbi:hypothetical protein, partial [Paraburkholderia sp. NMBU_R16]|uniref:hypothetical protein n=1 Tax=Paraburkholderia sp. NMBU_R16 TaxID=2698676 RepID=UPI001C268C15
LHALRNNANRAVPHRRQARFLQLQPACLVSRFTHCIFKRAAKSVNFMHSVFPSEVDGMNVMN